RTADGYLVARLEQVIAAQPAADKEGFAGFKREIADSLRNDIVSQFAAALRERYPVNVNTRALDQIY
ncbi:MAG: peptidylprolyl isomerase, partial [Rhodospirillales bacterium]